jgi:hypothetical protein
MTGVPVAPLTTTWLGLSQLGIAAKPPLLRHSSESVKSGNVIQVWADT